MPSSAGRNEYRKRLSRSGKSWLVYRGGSIIAAFFFEPDADLFVAVMSEREAQK